ncbi:MAG: DUF3592 domain-containing protein [Thermoguttaceae bacterium]
MARIFRFYEKKRGNRRTGSRLLGSVGEAVFFAVFLIWGCTWLVVAFVTLVVPEWRVNHHFVPQTCTVRDKRIGEDRGNSGLCRPEVQIHYTVAGTPYDPWVYDIHRAYSGSRPEAEAAIAAYVEGQRYVCWYDPARPEVAVLVRGYHGWNWLVLIVPLSFVAIGGGGLVYTWLHWGKSAESRAARLRRAPRDLLAAGGATVEALPGVPAHSDITSSPGTRLSFRLPMSNSPAWVLLGLLLACLAWNGLVSGFVVRTIHGYVERKPDWLLTGFTVAFLSVGVALIVLFVRQLLTTTAIGPTLVEISAHPLLPGEEYRVFVSQSGRSKIHRLDLLLICEEEAIYRQGTNTRTETRRVYCQPLLHYERCNGERTIPVEAECPLLVPAGAMHSFKGRHNSIHWKLLVREDVAGRTDIERSFPVVVHPLPQPGKPSGAGP